MLRFNKALNLRIITIVVLYILFCNTSVYSYSISINKFSLRPKLQLSTTDGRRRTIVYSLMDKIANYQKSEKKKARKAEDVISKEYLEQVHKEFSVNTDFDLQGKIWFYCHSYNNSDGLYVVIDKNGNYNEVPKGAFVLDRAKSRVHEIFTLAQKYEMDLERIVQSLIDEPHAITLNDTTLRDGIQLHPPISIEETEQLLDMLVDAGLSRIENGSFVRADKVPAMAETPGRAAYAQSNRERLRENGIEIGYLIFNEGGAQAAIENNPDLDEISVNVAASSAYSKSNIGSGDPMAYFRTKTVPALGTVQDHAIQRNRNIRLRGYISNVWGYKKAGDVPIKTVIEIIRELKECGVTELALSDTTSLATPKTVQQIIHRIQQEDGLLDITKGRKEILAQHSHDTGLGFLNTLAAFELGVRVFDTALANLGGSPFADHAPGNLSLEDTVFLLSAMGVQTTEDLEKLLQATNLLEQMLKEAYRRDNKPEFELMQRTRALGLHYLSPEQLTELRFTVQKELAKYKSPLPPILSEDIELERKSLEVKETSL